MTYTVKMPSPMGKVQMYTSDGVPYSEPTEDYTEAQLKQYGDDRAREVLDMAANVAKKYNHPIAGVIANEIRALEKEIK